MPGSGSRILTGARKSTGTHAGNDGEGLFQIGLPISVDEDCWNSGDDPTDHSKCDSSSATLTRVADAAKAESNDGMNCPVVWTVAETYAPSPQPIQCSEDEVCWSDMSIQAWDCAGAFSLSPVQVMRDGDDYYKAMTLDLETGEYEELFELRELFRSKTIPYSKGTGSNVGDPLLKRITKMGGVIQVAECSFNIPIRFVQNELLNMCAVVVLESLF